MKKTGFILGVVAALFVATTGCELEMNGDSERESSQGLVVTALDVSGAKTLFAKGDSFSLGNVIATYIDESTATISVDDVTFSGFDSSAVVASQKVTISYTSGGETVDASYTVEIKEKLEDIELGAVTWTLAHASSMYGFFLALDSTNGATSYDMTVDSVRVNGSEKLSSAAHITTDAYLTSYGAALASSDAAVSSCAQLVTDVGESDTVTCEYTVSNIQVTDATAYYWGVWLSGFTDVLYQTLYACRDDGWNCDLVAFADGGVTGIWCTETLFGSNGVSDGSNLLAHAPYGTGKIKLLYTINNGTKTATLTVYTTN